MQEKKRGRPALPKSERSSAMINVGLTEAQRADFVKKAREKGESAASMLRRFVLSQINHG